MPNYYNTGTVSVNNGATTVTGSAVLWSDLLAGDTLELAGQRVTIASVTDTTHFELAVAWSGTSQSGAAYLVRFDAPSRFTSGYLAEQVRALVARAGILEAARPIYEVQSLGSNTPPGSPVTNDMYVVGTAPTGAWAGQANKLAQWTGSAWLFTAADHGITVVSVATGIVSTWNGTAWTTFQTALGFTPVNKAGDSLTGRLSTAAGGTQGNSGIGTATANLGEIEVRGNGTGAAALAFHRPGSYGSYLGLDTDNKWKVGGWIAGAVAREIFHQGNAVGTVAQSGGVPTGAVIEQGSNANGNYVRYADGTQICWTLPAGRTITYTSASRIDTTWTFPAAFAGSVNIFVNLATLGSITGSHLPVTMFGDSITTTTARLSAVNGGTFVAGMSATATAIAIGRWF